MILNSKCEYGLCLTVAVHGEKATTSRGGGSKRVVKSAEQTESSSRRQTARRRGDDQLNNVSSENVDDESRYYAQHIAPVLDEMTGYVYSESSRGMRDIVSLIIYGKFTTRTVKL